MESDVCCVSLLFSTLFGADPAINPGDAENGSDWLTAGSDETENASADWLPAGPDDAENFSEWLPPGPDNIDNSSEWLPTGPTEAEKGSCWLLAGLVDAAEGSDCLSACPDADDAASEHFLRCPLSSERHLKALPHR